jgi:hypothetical protein
MEKQYNGLAYPLCYEMANLNLFNYNEIPSRLV